MSSVMSMELNMSREISEGLSRMIVEIVSKAVKQCGSVHNFDAEEMIRSMNLNDISVSIVEKKTKKAVVAKGAVAKVIKSGIPMPFLGCLKEGCCSALRQNHGLYTQCETVVKESVYCNKCGPSPIYGTIQQRLEVGIMEYRDPKGKAPTPFVKVMKKLKISGEDVLEEAGKLNIIINEIHFIEEESVEKKEKGRPKKPRRKIELADDSTDLFAALVAKANEDSEEEVSDLSCDEKSSIAESIVDSVLDKVSVIAEKKEKKTEKDAEKLAEKAVKDAEKLAEKEAAKLALIQKKESELAEKEAAKQVLIQEKEAAKLALIQKKESEKAEKEAAKLALIQKKESEKKPVVVKAVAVAVVKAVAVKAAVVKGTKAVKATKVEEEEEQDVVKRFEFEGVKYLKSKNTGIIYNMDQDVIGKWNEKTGKIDFEEAGSEEEEDEYDA